MAEIISKETTSMAPLFPDWGETDLGGKDNTVQAIERVLKILEVIRDKGKIGIRELSTLTGLSPSTVQRLVYTLEKNGYILREPFNQKCRLSHKFHYLARQAIAQSRLPALAIPLLQKLSRELKETMELTTMDKEGYIICVANIPFPDSYKNPFIIGNSFPAHGNAFGKVTLAFLPEADRNNILSALSLEAYTPHTITDQGKLIEELLMIIKKGYATSEKEQYGHEIMIAAPILDHLGVIGAFGIIKPAEKLAAERILAIGGILMRASKEISIHFGWHEEGKNNKKI